jgi:outer membrane protein assembly factor BamA
VATARPATAIAADGVPDPAELERRGATIGRIDVYVQNIFDLNDPREDHALYRAANHLHYRTRERTVRDQLLFAPGAPLSKQKLEETERILRSRRYLSDAWVVPVRYDEASNTAVVAVTVRDVWTLNPSVSFGRAGGQNRSSVSLEEENLLGTGSKLQIGHSHDVDRSSTLFSAYDPNIAGSWWQGTLIYADNSDGRVKSLALDRPFYALDTHRAYGLDLADGTSRVSRYSQGVVADQFDTRHSQHQAYYGWSDGLVGDWTERWYGGVRYDDSAFAPLAGAVPVAPLPADRKFVYPWLGWQLVENEFRKTENLDLIGRTEDVYVGRSLYAEVGVSNGVFGGRGNAVLTQLTALDAWQFGARQELFLSAAFAGRLDAGAAHNVSLTSQARYFDRLTAHQLFYVSLSGTVTHRQDADQQLLLGGDSGLRGYPIRFQGGTSSALLTVEHRVFTDWFPLRLVRVGGALFFDAGRTWGRDFAGAEPLGLLKDVGLGIRFGNVRSGLGNVIHVDLSYALDAPPGIKRVQVTVQTLDRF